MERHYPSYGDDFLKTALNQYAIATAQKLGLSLFTTEADTKGPLYSGILQSFGSTVPFEYTDGGGGIKSAGFVIINPQIMAASAK